MNNLCYYCGIKTIPAPRPGITHPPNTRTKDHIYPRCKGGKLSNNNVIACRKCNEDKDKLTIDEYKTVLAHRKNLIKTPDIKLFAGEPYKSEIRKMTWMVGFQIVSAYALCMLIYVLKHPAITVLA
jgi:hypothetical protein